MDNDQKKLISADYQKNKNNLVEFDFIKDKPHLIYLIKKAEKLAGAVHLVTSKLDSSEPLRTELRKMCLLLLKNILLFEKKIITDVSLESIVAECVTLLDIGRSSLLISQMNADLLRQEFVNLLPVLNALYSYEREQVSFDQEAFLVPPVEFALDEIEQISKGQYIKDSVLYNSNTPNPRPQSAAVKRKPKAAVDNLDSTRDRLILDVIKAKGEVGLKDISIFIKGVSGKTIQRDLLRLVGKGVLKKSGERRWSRYSLS
jgi:hypothetical protein